MKRIPKRNSHLPLILTYPDINITKSSVTIPASNLVINLVLVDFQRIRDALLPIIVGIFKVLCELEPLVFIDIISDCLDIIWLVVNQPHNVLDILVFQSLELGLRNLAGLDDFVVVNGLSIQRGRLVAS